MNINKHACNCELVKDFSFKCGKMKFICLRQYGIIGALTI